MTRIGIIGFGQMARALAAGMVRGRFAEGPQITAFDPDPQALAALSQLVPGARAASDNVQLAQQSDLLVLAVKPQVVKSVLAEIRPAIGPQHLLVSVAAGVSLTRLATVLESQRVVRVMPNLPALVGWGAAGYACGQAVTDDDRQLLQRLLECVGLAEEVAESLMDAVTGLAGSGPGWVLAFIESLIEAGVRVGLPHDVSRRLALQTVAGTVQYLHHTGSHPAAARDAVTSPGGTTAAGLAALERAGFRAAVSDAVYAATDRARQLGG